MEMCIMYVRIHILYVANMYVILLSDINGRNMYDPYTMTKVCM